MWDNGMSKGLIPQLVLIFMLVTCLVFAKPAVSSLVANENSWVTKAPLNQARAYLGVAVVNGKIYAIGGDNGGYMGNAADATVRTSSVVSDNEEYDPDSDTWAFKTPMLTARAGFASAVYQNRIYCMGGWTEDYSNTNSNEVYDPVKDEWETKQPMPANSERLVADVVNGKIYVLPLNSHETLVYDPEIDSWSLKASSPFERESVLGVVDNKIYSIGSYMSYSNPSNPRLAGAFIQIYDASTDSWSVGGNASTYGIGAAIGITTGTWAPKLICSFEGHETNVYDLANYSWTVGASMPTTRYCAGVAVVNDTFYVVGGRSGQLGYIVDIRASAVTEQYIPMGYGLVEHENSGLSETIPTPLVIAAAGATVIIVSVGLVVYFRKRKMQKP